MLKHAPVHMGENVRGKWVRGFCSASLSFFPVYSAVPEGGTS